VPRGIQNLMLVVDGEPPSSLARWSSTSEDEEFSIISNDAYVARTGITCPHCGQETEVICIHCVSGTASEQSLEQFTVFDIRAVNETLLQELKSWPGFRRTIEGGVVGAFANHCSRCGDAVGDMNLHSEPDQVFFDIVHAASGAIPRIASAKVLPVGVVASAEMLPAIAPATMASPLPRRGHGHQDDTLGAGRTDERSPATATALQPALRSARSSMSSSRSPAITRSLRFER
jgi:hypothetical protein